MPARVKALLNGTAFEPEVISKLTEAYELACAELPETTDHNAIARSIIAFARTGEHDPVKLSQLVVQSLQQSKWS